MRNAEGSDVALRGAEFGIENAEFLVPGARDF
jgi:hypothetical protein